MKFSSENANYFKSVVVTLQLNFSNYNSLKFIKLSEIT